MHPSCPFLPTAPSSPEACPHAFTKQLALAQARPPLGVRLHIPGAPPTDREGLGGRGRWGHRTATGVRSAAEKGRVPLCPRRRGRPASSAGPPETARARGRGPARPPRDHEPEPFTTPFRILSRPSLPPARRLLPPRTPGLGLRNRAPGIRHHLSPHHWRPRADSSPAGRRGQVLRQRPTSFESSPPWFRLLFPLGSTQPPEHSDDLCGRLWSLAGRGRGGACPDGAEPGWNREGAGPWRCSRGLGRLAVEVSVLREPAPARRRCLAAN